MNFKKVAILTSEGNWFVPYAQKLSLSLKDKGYMPTLFFKHENIDEEFKIVFVLNYYRIIEKEYLNKHKHNLVIHQSNLPKGKGWAPLFWQILKGKNRIPIVLFEAVAGMDEGGIYIKDYVQYKGYELSDELRAKQAQKIKELCLKFLDEYGKLKPKKQKGKPSFYSRRTPEDSELDINKTLKEQFNLLRTVNNEDFPAFFCYKNHKYVLRIYRKTERTTSKND